MPSHANQSAPPAALGRLSVRLGPSPVYVTALGLGTAALAGPYGVPGGERTAPALPEARATLEVGLERGLRFIDTAPAYGQMEAVVGEVCAGEDCAIATKLAIPEGGWSSLAPGEVESFTRSSVERSLVRLRRPHIDLLQVHNADVRTIEDGVLPVALAALRGEGVVRACGATVYGPENAMAALRCETFDAVQVAFSALDRRAERLLAPVAAERDRALIARSVLLRGVLSPAGRSLTGALAALRRAADEFRRAIGASWEELPGAAVAFVLSRPGIGSVLLGPRDSHELRQLLDGAESFASAARGLDGDWDAGLEPELLDPSRWPRG